MDIVFTTNNIHTLAYVIIVNPICANLVLQAVFSQKMTMTIVIQAKIVSYCDSHPEDDFILLTINIFGCLHKLMDYFFFIDMLTWHG
jgi:hypothetical protein